MSKNLEMRAYLSAVNESSPRHLYWAFDHLSSFPYNISLQTKPTFLSDNLTQRHYKDIDDWLYKSASEV